MKFLVNALHTVLGMATLCGALPGVSKERTGPALEKRANLQHISDFGSNPTGAKMWIYVPDSVSDNPPLVVAIHGCKSNQHCQSNRIDRFLGQKSANYYYANTPYSSLADQYGFIVLYPGSPNTGACWDASSQATLTRNGGGDSTSIINMLYYLLGNYGVDSTKIFVTGSSSGGIMAQTLSATYPDIFSAATVYSGVAATCFESAAGAVNAWNATCAQGNIRGTVAYWMNAAHDMYPGWTGGYPAMRLYHGSSDTTLHPPNLYEEIKQWTGLWGYSAIAQENQTDTPLPGYTTHVYGDNVQGVWAQGVGHPVPVNGDQDMEWFGLGS